MTVDYTRAARAVSRALAAKGWNAADLARTMQVDEGTVLDFLNGKRTPQTKTRGKLEAALGWPPGSLDDLASGDLIFDATGVLHGEGTVTSGEPAQTPTLSVVSPIVAEPDPPEEEENETLAAIRVDPRLDEDSRSHFLHQYELLVDLSAKRRAVGQAQGDPLPYVAHGQRTTPMDPEEERRLEQIAREAAEDPPE